MNSEKSSRAARCLQRSIHPTAACGEKKERAVDSNGPSVAAAGSMAGGVKSCSDFFRLPGAARIFVREWGKRELLLIPMNLTLMQQVNIQGGLLLQLVSRETKKKIKYAF